MDDITLLPLACLRESPSNPRRHYSEASLDELADSLRSQGLLQPITVRPIVQADIEHTHEIVFGHRRYRAALRAGLERIPAVVRAMSDADAALAQIHENLHRTDVHAIEEADAFGALMRDHGMTVDQIVADSGKSRSYVYGRLKLANLSPAVREACLSHGLGAEIALLLARLPAHKVQDEALQSLRQAGSHEWASFRQAKAMLGGYLVDLSVRAAFDLADANLPAGACSGCPKLACNDPDLHELAPTTCTDRGCFETKSTAHAVRTIALARECGREVIEGAQAAQMCHPYLHDVLNTAEILTDTAFERNGHPVTWADALQELPSDQRDTLHPALLVHPQNPLRPLDVLTLDQQARVLRALGVVMEETEGSARTPHAGTAAPADHPHAAAARAPEGGEGEVGTTEAPTWSAEEAAVAAGHTWRATLRAIFAQLLATPRTIDDLRLIARALLHDLSILDLVGDDLGLGDDDIEDVDAYITSLPADTLSALCVAASIEQMCGQHHVHNAWGQHTVARRLAIARTYGIDPLALAGQAQQSDEAGLPAGGAARGPVVADMFGDAGEADDEQVDKPAAPAPTPRLERPVVKYRCPATGMTWSGRGLKPKWLAVALEQGRTLADFEVRAS